MQYTRSFALLSLALSAFGAHAAPTASAHPFANITEFLLEKRQGCNPSDTEWCSPDGGNTQLAIGNGRMNMGSQPPWYVLDSLYDNCGGLACNREWGHGTTYGRGSRVESTNINVNVISNYDGNLSVGDLIEALKAVAGTPELYEVETVRSCERPCVGPRCYTACEWGTEPVYVDHYTAPDHFILRHQGDGGTSFIDVHLSAEDNGDGWCDLIGGVGGLVAGNVHPVAGGAFSVFQILCNNLP